MKVYKYLLGIGLLVLAGCSKSHPPAKGCNLNDYMTHSGNLKVLSTTAMIDDIVKKIGGDHIDSIVLIKGEIDPHSYELVKGDNEKLSRADVIFYNGLGLEHGASLRQKIEGHGCSIAVGDYLKQAFPERIIYIDGISDPHAWLDMSLWLNIIDPIQHAFCAKDPSHSSIYEENATKLKQELLSIHQELRAKMQLIPDSEKYLVTSHDAFNYFTRAYLCNSQDAADWQKRCAAPEGLAPEGQLSVADIQRMVDFVFQNKVRVVFAESNLSRDSLKKIVDACRIKGYGLVIAKERLFGDAMKETKEGYTGMLEHNISVLVEEWENLDE